MYKKILFLILISNLSANAQSLINENNYYSFYKNYDDYKKLGVKRLGVGRLDESEVAKILYQEMKLSGFEWVTNFKIINVEPDIYIISICYSEKSNFGFVFLDAFEAEPDIKTRQLERHTKTYGDCEYGEKIILPDGKSKWIKVERLPDNLYLIRRDPYWFQTTENEEINKTLVTREIAIQILRKDIQNILKSIKK